MNDDIIPKRTFYVQSLFRTPTALAKNPNLVKLWIGLIMTAVLVGGGGYVYTQLQEWHRRRPRPKLKNLLDRRRLFSRRMMAASLVMLASCLLALKMDDIKDMTENINLADTLKNVMPNPEPIFSGVKYQSKLRRPGTNPPKEYEAATLGPDEVTETPRRELEAYCPDVLALASMLVTLAVGLWAPNGLLPQRQRKKADLKGAGDEANLTDTVTAAVTDSDGPAGEETEQ